MLLNLTGNAIKFTEQGEIVVSLEVAARSAEAVRLKFTVKDTGIGMTEQQLALIFQSFSQAESSISRRYGGTGLGLAISKRLVEMMGGEIKLLSKLGKGSIFTFDITFKVSGKEIQYKPLNSENLRGKRILIVDDNKTNLKIAGQMLESFGALITTVLTVS